MTSDDITNIGFWIDKAIKVVIAVAIAIASFEYRNIKNSLDDLQEKKHILLGQIEAIEKTYIQVDKRLERIELKIDRVVERIAGK
jgi:tetrahydromethanopterin S-methyltransferase subunit G